MYQKRGFRIEAVYPNTIEGACRLKPEIPLLDREGIPIRDELELDCVLIFIAAASPSAGRGEELLSFFVSSS